MPTPTILVLGSTGAIGGALIQRLLPDHDAGRIRLVAASRRSEPADELERHGVEYRRVDLDDAEPLGLEPIVDAVRGIDRVFLLTSYDVKMLAQSKAVIDASSAAGVAHVVHLGAHASPTTTIVHLGWHQLVEAYLGSSGLAYTNLHPTSFMHNLLMLTGIGGAAPGVLPHYIGDARTSWVDADDVADAAAVVLQDPEPHAGRSYLLGAEVASMREVTEALSSVTGVPWREEQREPEMFFQTVTAAGADPVYMACVRTIFERTSQGTLPDLEETSDALERLRQRGPTSIRSFVQRHREQFLQRAGAPA
jgi:NAD(P)H dehydrogenase (quinone)